jgi:F-type H+-transporting ATPase subunit epsilon
VLKVISEAENGCFCLLPRHIDFVAALVPGILTFVESGGNERFVAIDEGALTKVGQEVLVSTRRAAAGERLGNLRRLVEQQYEAIDERERMARSASARLEAGLVRRFMEFEKHAF